MMLMLFCVFYVLSMCSLQYGWQTAQLKPVAPKHGRGQSDITKFAAELVKNGVYY